MGFVHEKKSLVSCILYLVSCIVNHVFKFKCQKSLSLTDMVRNQCWVLMVAIYYVCLLFMCMKCNIIIYGTT